MDLREIIGPREYTELPNADFVPTNILACTNKLQLRVPTLLFAVSLYFSRKSLTVVQFSNCHFEPILSFVPITRQFGTQFCGDFKTKSFFGVFQNELPYSVL